MFVKEKEKSNMGLYWKKYSKSKKKLWYRKSSFSKKHFHIIPFLYEKVYVITPKHSQSNFRFDRSLPWIIYSNKVLAQTHWSKDVSKLLRALLIQLLSSLFDIQQVWKKS